MVDSVKCHLKQKNGENRGPNPNCRCIDSVCDLKIMGLSNKTHHLKTPPVSLLKLKRFVWSGCGGSPPNFSATVNTNNMKDDMFPTPPLRSLKLCEVKLSPFPAIPMAKNSSHQILHTKLKRQTVHYTLPKTNIAPENTASQKESRLWGAIMFNRWFSMVICKWEKN